VVDAEERLLADQKLHMIYPSDQNTQPLEQVCYEVKFEIAYLRAKGDAFQTFFEDLMTRAYKGDFMACRPWGNRGDHKNDGFLKSERRLFQAYAPNEMTEADAIKKINEDLDGAKAYWKVLFDKWSFVHNAIDGLPPHVHKAILDLEFSNPGLTLDLWGLEELRLVFRRLSRADLESWFGYVPTASTKARLSFEDIRVVLEALEIQRVTDDREVKDVPPKKIEANALSPGIARLLKEGIVKAVLVDDFFRKWRDPEFGERIAQAFRVKYAALRDQLTPNEIYHELEAWIGGRERGTAEHELAVMTVLAYYFERCDIFEEPHAYTP
jgi:hypothetical protein